MKDTTQNIGQRILRIIEHGGLIVITLATLVAGVQEVLGMFAAGRVTLSDLLMLFIYLEVIAMVAVYLESGKLPVRMPLYIAIVALARYLALDIKSVNSWEIIAVAGAVLILTISVLLIRYGALRFPYPPVDHDPNQQPEHTSPTETEKQN